MYFVLPFECDVIRQMGTPCRILIGHGHILGVLEKRGKCRNKEKQKNKKEVFQC